MCIMIELNASPSGRLRHHPLQLLRLEGVGDFLIWLEVSEREVSEDEPKACES